MIPNNHQLLSLSFMKRRQSNSPKVNLKRPRVVESSEVQQIVDNSEWTKVERRKATKGQKSKVKNDVCVLSYLPLPFVCL